MKERPQEIVCKLIYPHFAVAKPPIGEATCFCKILPTQIIVFKGKTMHEGAPHCHPPFRFSRVNGARVPKYSPGWRLAEGELERLNRVGEALGLKTPESKHR